MSQASTKILKSPKISKLGLQLPDYYRTDLTVASICYQISRSFFQNAWEIRIRAEIFFQKKWKSNFDSKKFRLFCANKAVLSVLSKEPRFLTKTTGIFFMPKNNYFFYSRKKRESFLHPKKVPLFSLKENGNLFF